jgi:hypothetical protein
MKKVRKRYSKMVKAIINVNEQGKRILNILKAKFNLKNKSEVITLILKKFEDNFFEPELRPEYKDELLRVDKGSFKPFSSVKELRKEVENV